MAGMILSTYVFRVFSYLPLVAQGIWWFSFLLDLTLIAGFTIKFACPGRRVHATQAGRFSMGDSSGCLDLSSGRYYRNCLCDLEFWFSLDLLSLSLIYSDLKKHPLPLALLGQEGIYCAPFSLLLASLVRVGGTSLPTWVLIVMILASQSFFFLF